MAASEVAKAEPVFDQRGVFGGKRQSKATRSGDAAIAFATRKYAEAYQTVMAVASSLQRKGGFLQMILLSSRKKGGDAMCT